MNPATLPQIVANASPHIEGPGLIHIFVDLMAYVIFFESSAGQQTPLLSEVRQKILALIDAQEQLVKEQSFPFESYIQARFAVLSLVDEMIVNSNWSFRNKWEHLTLRFYETANAGEEFFRRLELLPSKSDDIREIFYLCLGLGFKGKYAVGNYAHKLTELKQTLYRQLCGSNGDIRRSYARLFPEAYLKMSAAPKDKSNVKPFWYIIAVSIPIILFVCYFVLLRNEASRLIASLDIAIVEPPFDGSALLEDLRRKNLVAEDTPRGVVITLGGLLFEIRSAALNRDAQLEIEDVVEIVNRRAPQRRIAVEAYTSKEPGVSEEINRKLSEDRAQAVAQSFIRAGFSNNKIMARGFGSKIPLAPNDTETGRARNRRVEIIVMR